MVNCPVMDLGKVRRMVKEGKERNARLMEAVNVIIYADAASIASQSPGNLAKMMWIIVRLAR